MRFGITARMFLAIFSTCMLVLIIMHFGVRLSFEKGFIDYIRHGNEQRAVQIKELLEEQYQLHGNWEFLRSRDQGIFSMIRTLDQNSNEALQGWRTRFWVLDNNRNRLLGPPVPLPADSTTLPLIVQQHTVGFIVSAPVEGLTRSADINFDRQQQRTSWLIVAFTTLLAAVVTWRLSRGLLAPVKRLVNGIHQLAGGDFSTRVRGNERDELGRLAQDFNQLASALEKNEQSRRAFMADISHELRTPLAVLRGELEALQDGVRKPDTAAFSSLQAEVVMLAKLVDDLHQLSLSDLGALAYRKSAVNVSTLLQVAVAAFNERFQHKQIALHTHLHPQAVVFGDPDRLSQLFNNFLENSLRYTDEGGRLTVETELRPQWLVIHWHDSAPGITDEQLSLIFERFYRAESSRNRASGGSGLGLAICANIVEAHEGRLYAGHSPLGGVHLTVELPLHLYQNR
ncbi:two-component system sensor histidine kinase BaeS [Dickeya lacustris]|uniref:histidine kinase n=1 Tax=Dickeya lacustris TaxID=2259638 RepID=A0ABY8GA95_9GAMM|nr:two-component system sensor histidine kinase BaeS [Dickeya lacustris]WFN56827.1 two-component system sensor histidine kinase BaeS [Dickeya lacustris]